MKGHDVRVMICTKRHVDVPTFTERTLAYGILINYMQSKMNHKPWYIVEDTFSSIRGHWHIISCDEKGTPEELELLDKTPKVKFPLPQRKRILIGIPAFNEEKTIFDVVSRAKKYGVVMVVNDGSTDNTADLALKAGAEVTENDKNYGYGYSLSKIFRKAKRENYDVLITLDADGQHNPDEIPKFLETLDLGVDVVIGSRFLSQTPVPRGRSFGVAFISRLEGYSDAQCGFRAYNRNAIENISVKEDGMGASLEILHQSQNLKLKVSEIPCTVLYTNTEHTHHPLKHGSLLLETFLWSRVWCRPFTYFGIPALLFLLLGFVSLIQLLNVYVQYHVFITSWTALTLGGLTFGLVLLSSSILLYLLKRALEEMK